MRKYNLGLVIKGFLMGTADVIPGISGGTIAFLTGIYEELVKTIAGFNPANLLKIFKDEKAQKKCHPRLISKWVWRLYYYIIDVDFSPKIGLLQERNKTKSNMTCAY